MKKIMLLLMTCLMVSCSGTTSSPTEIPVPTSTPVTTPTAATCNLSEVGAFIDQVLVVYQKFKGQIEVIRTAEKFDLANEIEELKEIKTEAEELKTNPCTIKLYDALLEGMDRSIEQVSGLLADSSESARTNLSNTVDSLFVYISEEISRLFACLPNCTP